MAALISREINHHFIFLQTDSQHKSILVNAGENLSLLLLDNQLIRHMIMHIDSIIHNSPQQSIACEKLSSPSPRSSVRQPAN